MLLWRNIHKSWVWQLVFLFVCALFLMVIYPKTGLDERLIRPYFNSENQHFNLKHDWFLEKVLHTGLKYALILVAISTLLASIIGNIFKPLKPYRQRLLWVFVIMLVSTSLVSLLKHYSIHGCPSDLIQYGGNLAYLQLFDTLPEGAEMGNCFPGGHASGGFALMAFYFGFRDVNPKFAQMVLMFSVMLGFVMGWAQMMRGEHFLSHNLWSAWVVWAVCVVCQPLLFIQQLKESH